MKNVFFIQRAAIDVLLLNQATAMDICTYLVIAKYTDRDGYYSGVGYKTIKERLGVGQKKVAEAIKRLKNMEYAGKRLLYDCKGWFFKQSGRLPDGTDNVGWIREWFESEYKHHVWLTNDLVGSSGDQKKPLNYFVKHRGKDNHAKLLLLLYKYCNRQYSGVNYKFASITSKIVLGYNINGIEFNRSELAGYHISDNILNKIGLSLNFDDISDILSDLIKSNFINVSVSVLGKSQFISVPAGKEKPLKHNEKRLVYSDKQYNSFLAMKASGSRHSYKLAIKHGKNAGNSKIRIKLVRYLEDEELVEFSQNTFAPLKYPDTIQDIPDTKFIYRLDYKSQHKRKLNGDKCLATKIESITDRCGLAPASRKGKFYSTYWWFNHGERNAGLVGILMPTYIPFTNISNCDAAMNVLDALRTSQLTVETPDLPLDL